VYFTSPSNAPDCVQIICHSLYFCLKIADWKNARDSSIGNLGAADDLQNVILILTAVLYLTIVGRIQHFIKIYEDYGLLTELIAQSIYKVVPFLVIFLLWNCLFAMELYILKSNLSDVEGFKGIPTAIGYFFIAFENG